MVRLMRSGCTLAAVVILFAPALAQNAVEPRAATVNGEPIPEKAVQRALRQVPKEHAAKARVDILNYLIDNALIDQHLVKLKVEASKEEIETRLAKIKEEIKKGGQDLEQLLQKLMLTEAELRGQVAADLRWDLHVKKQADDKVLTKFFTENKDWFDNSQVRARHVLAALPPDADAKVREAAKAKLLAAKKQVEAQAAREMAKVDPKADNIAKEQARLKAMNEAFAAVAIRDSDCPSKSNGGDLGLFPRVGAMVEPFAKAAFALQSGQMSDIVETQFGFHLILVTARQPGMELKFEDVKDAVREVYADRLRAELVPQLRKTAKIDIAKQ